MENSDSETEAETLCLEEEMDAAGLIVEDAVQELGEIIGGIGLLQSRAAYLEEHNAPVRDSMFKSSFRLKQNLQFLCLDWVADTPIQFSEIVGILADYCSKNGLALPAGRIRVNKELAGVFHLEKESVIILPHLLRKLHHIIY